MAHVNDDLGRPLDGPRSARATRLLASMVRTRRSGALALLVDRLEADGGSTLLTELLTRWPMHGAELATELLVSGKASLVQLRTWKDHYKGLYSHPDEHDRLVAVLGYYLTQAAGLVHHQARLGTLPPGQLEDALVDLSSALPAPWDRLCQRAADAL